MRRRWAMHIGLALGLVSLVGWPGNAFGHDGATGIVKERMDFMKELGDATKALAAMYKGEIGYEPDVARRHAEVIEDHAPSLIGYFPENSNEPPSESRDEIWERWEEFERLAEELEATSGAFLTAVESSDDIEATRRSFTALGRSCSACHDDFRAEQN